MIPPSYSLKYLNDICLIRLLLIVLLVFYHSFCVFCGAWSVPDGFPQNEVYWWMAKVPISFFLEVFTFISGYLFGNVVRSKGVRMLTFENCVVKKMKRLIIPSDDYRFCILSTRVVGAVTVSVVAVGRIWSSIVIKPVFGLDNTKNSGRTVSYRVSL